MSNAMGADFTGENPFAASTLLTTDVRTTFAIASDESATDNPE
ncbi:MAG: hypothetical protein AAFQ74_15940 [Cyanobacteria bacterium J06623_4]